MLLLLFAPACAAVAVAGHRSKDQIMRFASPGFVALFLGVGIWQFRLSFRKIEPTDHNARHADDHAD